jgi:hypothetical protein
MPRIEGITQKHKCILKSMYPQYILNVRKSFYLKLYYYILNIYIYISYRIDTICIAFR